MHFWLPGGLSLLLSALYFLSPSQALPASTEIETREKTITFREDNSWKAADLSDIRVKAGSALDLSGRVEPGPAGKHGRVIVTPEGQLAFTRTPKQPLRFIGYDMVTPQTLSALKGDTTEETHANIREFVTLVKRQGYNILRTLALDAYLMGGSDAEGKFNPQRLDAFEYLFATMKQEGVYLYLDLSGYGLYFRGTWKEKVDDRSMKAELFSGDPRIRENWKNGVTLLLTRVNPYSQTTLRDDPTVVCVNYYNEQELGFCKLYAEPNPGVYTRLWREWLKKKYASADELGAAWKTSDAAHFSSMDEVPLPSSPYGVDAVGRDFAAFLYGLEMETLDWYRRTVSAIGYKGLASQYDCNQIYREGAARSALPTVSMHGYHAHPSNTHFPGSRVAQNSSVETGGSYFRGISSTREWEKPFLVTEHAQCFWNQYQHEDGLLFAAYSALQNYDCLLVQENAVLLKVTEPLQNFTMARSPIGRANEFLSHQLFQRGDVTPSPHRVEVRIEPAYVEANFNRALNSFQTRLALLTGFGVRYLKPGQPAPRREPDLLLAPAEGGKVSATDWVVTLSESASGGDFSLPKTIDTLRKGGILAGGNRTNPAAGIYQSDTGEITLTAPEKKLSVITRRTEGVTLLAQKSATLSALTVQSSSVDATIAVTSIDGRPLGESQRMVLLYITDSANTGMELSADRVTLVQLGKLPALLRTGQLHVTLRLERSSNLTVWALAVNGERRERIPATARHGALEITVDTAKLQNGPTPFFEIAEDARETAPTVP